MHPRRIFTLPADGATTRDGYVSYMITIEKSPLTVVLHAVWETGADDTTRIVSIAVGLYTQHRSCGIYLKGDVVSKKDLAGQEGAIAQYHSTSFCTAAADCFLYGVMIVGTAIADGSEITDVMHRARGHYRGCQR